METWEEASELCLDMLNSHRYGWGGYTDSKKRMILDWVYDITSGAGTCRNGKVDSGLISKEAIRANKKTADHFISPRFRGRSIMDDNQHILDDSKKFKKTFRSSQTVIWLTKEQNMNMRYHHNNGIIRIPQLTKDKYNEIKFWSKANGGGWVKGFPLVNEIPEWYTNSERKYLIRG